MYPPKHHQENNLDNIKLVAKSFPFATLISVKENKPIITHAPLIFKQDKLVGHIDKNNPHADILKNEHPITVIFQGPQAYISPSIYTTKQLPTWNYLIAHANGVVKEIDDPNIIKQSIVNMTAYLEAPDHKFVIALNDPRMDRLVPHVHGFEIDIKQWEGKFKLSQDKIPADIDAAKHSLIKSNQIDIQDFINDIFEAHF